RARTLFLSTARAGVNLRGILISPLSSCGSGVRNGDRLVFQGVTKAKSTSSGSDTKASKSPITFPIPRRAEGQVCIGEWSCARDLRSDFYVSTILVSPSLLKQ